MDDDLVFPIVLLVIVWWSTDVGIVSRGIPIFAIALGVGGIGVALEALATHKFMAHMHMFHLCDGIVSGSLVAGMLRLAFGAEQDAGLSPRFPRRALLHAVSILGVLLYPPTAHDVRRWISGGESPLLTLLAPWAIHHTLLYVQRNSMDDSVPNLFTNPLFRFSFSVALGTLTLHDMLVRELGIIFAVADPTRHVYARMIHHMLATTITVVAVYLGMDALALFRSKDN